ncbi:RNA-binding protein [bacterium]|nr:RNA-binding protein [bacterium]
MDIYIGNLPKEITEEDLQKTFEPFGEVEIISIIKDKLTGKSKGFGFVEMSSRAEGQVAIKSMNGKKLKKRKLIVREVLNRSGERRKSSNGRRHLL